MSVVVKLFDGLSPTIFSTFSTTSHSPYHPIPEPPRLYHRSSILINTMTSTSPAHPEQVHKGPAIQQMVPGEWNDYIRNNLCNFKDADLRSTLQMTTQRDILLRITKDWNARQFNDSLRNDQVVAAMAYMVGTIAPTACHDCGLGRGPFAHCVVVSGLFGGACGNCLFEDNYERCSLRQWGRVV